MEGRALFIYLLEFIYLFIYLFYNDNMQHIISCLSYPFISITAVRIVNMAVDYVWKLKEAFY